MRVTKYLWRNQERYCWYYCRHGNKWR